MDRPICDACNKRFAAINRYFKGKIYYRKKCDSCIRKGRETKLLVPKWSLAGYKQKTQCDRCGFRAKSLKQTVVYHLDKDLNNCNLNNLRTVCLNCSVEVMQLELPFTKGDLLED
jgi:hypothetical protein